MSNSRQQTGADVLGGCLQVDGAFRRPPILDKIVLHHYFTRSWMDFLRKMAKGSGDGGRKGWGAFVEMEESATDDCAPALDNLVK